jgi:putative CocE/NonD family hydrolase
MRNRVFLCAVGAAMVVAIAPAEAQVRHRFDVRIPMRDGVELSANIWMPEAPGRYPAVMERTPYNKSTKGAAETGWKLAQRGYVYIEQDSRGRGDSDGEFSFLASDRKDGYDTIGWIARQSWSNGKVAMMGSSYRASAAWMALKERPANLSCLISQVPVGDYFTGIPYQGGAFNLQWSLGWIFGVSGRVMRPENALTPPGPWYLDVLRQRPLATLDSVYGRPLPVYQEWLRHPTYDDYWKRISFTPEDYRAIDIPILFLTGWFDFTQPGTMSHWAGVQQHSPAKNRQHLLVGPWSHGVEYSAKGKAIGDLQFTDESMVDIDSVRLAFLDHCLKGTPEQFDFPRARVYVMGSNQWRDLEVYPPPGAVPRPLYLTSGGKANTAAGDGRLVWEAPSAAPADQFSYDPRDPVPSRPGKEPPNVRQDVLVYTSDALTEPVEIIGPVAVVLHAATDARDTDFTARIFDVTPEGKPLKLGTVETGVVRARYRKGFDREVLVTPGAAEEYTIQLGHQGYTFLAGHRIRVEISSSFAPYVNPNPNTGNPVATDTEWKVARQTIYHDRARPSRLLLPVVR